MEPKALPPRWEIPEEHLSPPDEWWHRHDSEEWRNPELPLEDGKVVTHEAVGNDAKAGEVFQFAHEPEEIFFFLIGKDVSALNDSGNRMDVV
ncbi:MAG: hypothetical protein P1V20_19740 [Verrucomicrobiales bacterium]|nr:hypothetical protein [Verrucomicrobiales bacterium]